MFSLALKPSQMRLRSPTDLFCECLYCSKKELIYGFKLKNTYQRAIYFMVRTEAFISLVVLGRAYRGLTAGLLLLRKFSVAISVSPHVCFIFFFILISMFLR